MTFPSQPNGSDLVVPGCCVLFFWPEPVWLTARQGWGQSLKGYALGYPQKLWTEKENRWALGEPPRPVYDSATNKNCVQAQIEPASKEWASSGRMA